MKRSLVRTIAMAGALGGAGSLWVACNGDDGTGDMGTGGGDVTAATGTDTKYVINELKLPNTRSEFAIDLNGDGTKDNALGNIIGAISAQGLDAAKGVADSLAMGDVILLITLKSDAIDKDEDGAGATFSLGQKKANPDFSGMGMFTVDSGQAPSQFLGKITSSKFNANNPVTTKSPTKITLKLSLIAGAEPLTLAVNGAHVSFTTTATGLTNGELHGSIKNSDIQTGIVPAVASLLTKQIADNPSSSSSTQILSIFDTGGTSGTCTNPDGSKANVDPMDATKSKPDKKIDICEVAENSIIMNVLAPDVQIYDAAGNYAPQKTPTAKDSLSLGLGFSAVKATF